MYISCVWLFSLSELSLSMSAEQMMSLLMQKVCAHITIKPAGFMNLVKVVCHKSLSV